MNNIIFLVLLSTFSSCAWGLVARDLRVLNNTLRRVVRGGNIPTVVRLAFHDCVGGCDGCLNIDNPDNAGLQDMVAALEEAYQSNSLSSLLSRADYWAYASIYAIEAGIKLSNKACTSTDCLVPDLNVPFQYGRVDCATAPYYSGNVGLPSANLDHNELLSFFASEFGFSEPEVVALMGVHTLGAASLDNSGYKGAWVFEEPNRFNNKYYKIMVDSNSAWRQSDVSEDSDPPRFQWKSPSGMMLNADMAIYKDIQLDSDGSSSCTYDECGLTSSSDTVLEFANSNDAWVPKFASVFNKIISHGNFTLQSL